MKPLNIIAGTFHKLRLVYTDKDQVPINVTTATARFIIRKSMRNPIVVDIAGDTSKGNGLIEIPIPGSATEDLLKDDVVTENFIFGVLLTLQDGSVVSLLQGKAVVTQNIAWE